MTTVVFGVSEYTLVFRRVFRPRPGTSDPARGWVIARPMQTACPELPAPAGEGEVEQLLTVRIYSTLAMEDAAYERFLLESGALPAALRLVARVRLKNAQSVEMTRRGVQSLVMEAEVRHIADTLSA
jgi:hypothetical protein